MKHEDSSLQPDEVILWSGKPMPNKWIGYGDYLYIPYSVFVGGFLMYWEYLAIVERMPATMHLLGIPAAVIGFYIVFGRFIYKGFRMKSVTYHITNQRVIEAYDSNWFKTKSKALVDFDKMVRFEEKDGSGTLLFADLNPAIIMKVNNGMEWLRKEPRAVVGFYDVPEVMTRFEHIKSLQQLLKAENVTVKTAED